MCSAGRATPSCRGICEAVSRPTMRFAAIKSVEQQSALTLHRAREILVKQETMLANLIRGCLGEFGIVAPLGIRRIAELVGIIRDETDSRIPPHARIAMTAVAEQLGDLQRRIKEIKQAIRAWHRNNDASRRLATIPGVGIITASAIAATIATVPPAVGETPGWSLRSLGRGRKLRGTDGGGRPEAVPLDEPSGVVDLPELDQCVAKLLDGVEGAHPEQVLFQGADEALGAAVAFRRSHEGG